MKLLGVDYGLKRIGLALAEDEVVVPWQTLKVVDEEEAVAEIARLCRERQIERVVVGLPVRLNGSPSPMTRRARRFGRRLGSVSGLEVVYNEEQLTTRQAVKLLRKARLSRRKGLRDQMAAAVILKDYLGSI
jgi:putative Holliday junction resolvase